MSNKKKTLDSYAKYSGLAFQMAAIILIGALTGKKLDEYFLFQSPYLTIILSLISICLALYFSLKDFISPPK